MPSKKKKYNARFPAGRIKKIMQSDEEIGKVAQAVPVILSRTLELFVESLLTKTLRITNARSAKTLSPSHMKQCIMSEQRFDFLKELVRNIPDISIAEEASNYNDSSEEAYPDSDTPYDLSLPSTSMRNGNNNSNSFMRSVSLNGGALKRSHPPSTPSTLMQTVASVTAAKLARSESTPAYTPRGRPPNSSRVYSCRDAKNTTAIPEPMCNYELLNKPVVKIEYSNVQLPSTTVSDAHSPLDIPAPVINIDLSNIVATTPSTPAKATTITTPKICYGGTNNNNNSLAKISAPIIPKAPTATAPVTNTLFELDEDYDNI
ncbi:NC2alpha [Drosophila busckii]|uniref:NC2alpha n=1 Tax=Drosophila busckii TaxID=30019 RepID=A0A0M4EL93_DROBS|nr:dr1-associated corepressor homolog [Drosophila busckii]ALC42305.1 NC2alpha [Drosophila busckii]